MRYQASQSKDLYTASCNSCNDVSMYISDRCSMYTSQLVFDFDHMDIKHANTKCPVHEPPRWSSGQSRETLPVSRLLMPARWWFESHSALVFYVYVHFSNSYLCIFDNYLFLSMQIESENVHHCRMHFTIFFVTLLFTNIEVVLRDRSLNKSESIF